MIGKVDSLFPLDPSINPDWDSSFSWHWSATLFRMMFLKHFPEGNLVIGY